MKKKTLKEKPIAVVNKVVQKNKPDLTNKIENVLDKSIKTIVKKTDKQTKKHLKKKKL